MQRAIGTMKAEQFERLIEAINKHAQAIESLADAIAGDEPLNYSIARGLDKVANSICFKDKNF